MKRTKVKDDRPANEGAETFQFIPNEEAMLNLLEPVPDGPVCWECNTPLKNPKLYSRGWGNGSGYSGHCPTCNMFRQAKSVTEAKDDLALRKRVLATLAAVGEVQAGRWPKAALRPKTWHPASTDKYLDMVAHKYLTAMVGPPVEHEERERSLSKNRPQTVHMSRWECGCEISELQQYRETWAEASYVEAEWRPSSWDGKLCTRHFNVMREVARAPRG